MPSSQRSGVPRVHFARSSDRFPWVFVFTPPNAICSSPIFASLHSSHPLVLLVPRTMGIQARTGWLLDTLPSEHSRRKPSWKKRNKTVRMFHGIVSQDFWTHLRQGQRPVENCGMLDPKRQGGTEVWRGLKRKSNEQRAIPCSSYPLMIPWNQKSPVCVCACVSGLFQFGIRMSSYLYNLIQYMYTVSVHVY